jgi:hypothetical protein
MGEVIALRRPLDIWARVDLVLEAQGHRPAHLGEITPHVAVRRDDPVDIARLILLGRTVPSCGGDSAA